MLSASLSARISRPLRWREDVVPNGLHPQSPLTNVCGHRSREWRHNRVMAVSKDVPGDEPAKASSSGV